MIQTQAKTNSSITLISPIDLTPIIKSESSTAVILACAILISTLLAYITKLVEVIMKRQSR
ncbi:MAG: hypothetical protein HC916_14420 [Coleofasciculaceae cyanobacterium SM2_1_6]|nr:hypothetical protein [Coleofasciculaceae cyanobacterium SM2_1_6]